jgi:hypothetical protein
VERALATEACASGEVPYLLRGSLEGIVFRIRAYLGLMRRCSCDFNGEVKVIS